MNVFSAQKGSFLLSPSGILVRQMEAALNEYGTLTAQSPEPNQIARGAAFKASVLQTQWQWPRMARAT